MRTRVRDRSRAAGKRAHAVASKLRSRAALGRDEATAAVLKSTGELAGLAETAAPDSQRRRPGAVADSCVRSTTSRSWHCLKQSEGDFRRFASAIHQVACDV